MRAIKAQHAADRTPIQAVADRLTSAAASTPFFLFHVAWFALWIAWNVGLVGGRRFDPYPFGLLTMIVSLEAIFLSTFVMISQNRADERRQVIADEAWRTVQEEEQQNEILLRLSNEILDLTKEIHAASAAAPPPDRPGAQAGAARPGERDEQNVTYTSPPGDATKEW